MILHQCQLKSPISEQYIFSTYMLDIDLYQIFLNMYIFRACFKTAFLLIENVNYEAELNMYVLKMYIVQK